jgi:uncharacterized repeat protein (TIGR03803 family)
MKTVNEASCYALGISLIAALLAACGASQPPIGAPGALPQVSAAAARTNRTNYKLVYNFDGPSDGRNPVASLIDVRGMLYGTTDNGGSSCYSGDFCGTVFSITPSGKERVLHTFGIGTDGSNPEAGLIDVGRTLYGTTAFGGSYVSERGCFSSVYAPCGTVFSITPSGTEKVLHSFGSRTDGLDPVASLIEVRGTLYGTTFEGGARKKCRNGRNGCGKVFSITPSGTEKVLHSFRGGSDGAGPTAPLIDVNGTLYGTTAGGGAYGGGTVFSITLSGKEKVLHSFGNETDGAGPIAGLIDMGGTLYGTTGGGGTLNCKNAALCGTVFSLTLSGREKVLHAFSGNPDGANPVASLIEVNGTLYGTTEFGGVYSCNTGGSCGTVFSITPSGTEKVLYSFGRRTDGKFPVAALTNVDGALYGTTEEGGTANRGTVFALKP